MGDDFLKLLDNASGNGESIDDLFNMDRLGELANELNRKAEQIDYDQARQLGILKS